MNYTKTAVEFFKGEIAQQGVNLHKVARNAKLDHGNVWRLFNNPEVGNQISLTTIVKLANSLGFEVTIQHKSKKSKVIL